MKLTSFLIILFSFLLTGCGTENSSGNKNSNLDKYEVLNTEAEGVDGDFIYRLVSEKATYTESDSVSIYAELEYAGNQDQVIIYHAASPFHFPFHEKTRDFKVGYGMEQPLLHTTLLKGKPLRERYIGSSGYSGDESREFADFVQSIMRNQFPSGYYVMQGYADFYIGTLETKEKEYRISAEIKFIVEE